MSILNFPIRYVSSINVSSSVNAITYIPASPPTWKVKMITHYYYFHLLLGFFPYDCSKCGLGHLFILLDLYSLNINAMSFNCINKFLSQSAVYFLTQFLVAFIKQESSFLN